MSDSLLAFTTVTSLRAAHAARDRLSRAGFARNSIEIARHAEGFAVSIATRPENHRRAEQLLAGSPLGNDLNRAGAEIQDAVRDNRFLALGLAALVGFVLFRATRPR